MGFINTSWNVFVEGEKTTYPTVYNKPILIFRGNDVQKNTCCVVVFTPKGFCDIRTGKVLRFKNSAFWMYLPKLPDAIKTQDMRICDSDTPCQYEDDGYCFDKPANYSCKYCRTLTQYVPMDK